MTWALYKSCLYCIVAHTMLDSNFLCIIIVSNSVLISYRLLTHCQLQWFRWLIIHCQSTDMLCYCCMVCRLLMILGMMHQIHRSLVVVLWLLLILLFIQPDWQIAMVQNSMSGSWRMSSHGLTLKLLFVMILHHKWDILLCWLLTVLISAVVSICIL